MIVEKIVTNINKIEKSILNNLHLEKVYLESSDLLKRVQRVTSDHGREIGIRLKDNKDLEEGDVLYLDDHDIIVVSVVPDDLLVIYPKTLMQMGDIAHKIGNRHLPAQFEDDVMLVQYDYLVESLLKELGLDYSREQRTVKHPFRHIGH